MTIHGKNYINGKFYGSNCPLKPQKTFAKINPSNKEILGHWPETDRSLVNEAISAARKAQKSWRQLSRVKRAEYFDVLAQNMVGFKDMLIEAMCQDTGKSYNEAYAEFNESLHMAQYTFSQGREPFGNVIASEIAEKDIITFRKPKGVVAVISAWNFPLAIGAFWNSAPALLEGNTVVFKPSEDAPRTAAVVAHLYDQSRFPAGVFNVIYGKAATGDALVKGDVDHICFTGSAAVGKVIRRECADSFKKTCSCEMGSKSAVVVFDDVAMDFAVNACLTSAFKLSGQRCVSASRLLVHEKIYEEFCQRFVDSASKIKVGTPFLSLTQEQKNGCGADIYDKSVFYGPIINESQFERIKKYNELTHRSAKILLEGKSFGPGFYLTPHVYTCNWDYNYEEDEFRNKIYPFLREEVFGPHVAIIPFKDVDDAVHIYNDTPYGLSLATLTNNMHIARYMRDNCDYGLGYHNLPCIGAESHLPFSGVKMSGYGGASAAGTFKAVTHEVTWTTNYNESGFTMAQGLK